MSNLLQMAARERDRMVSLLKRLVAVETPTSDKSANDRAGVLIATQIETLGAAGEVVRDPFYGAHVVGRWPCNGPGGLIIGHMDTVWPSGTLSRMGFAQHDGRISDRAFST